MGNHRSPKTVRTPSLLTWYLRLPWWYHLLSSGLVYFILRYSFFRVYDGMYMSDWEEYVYIYAPCALATLPVLFAVGSGYAAWKKKSWLFAQSTLTEIRRLSWQQFEVLIGAAFERLGYRVKETGGGGADGGKDLILTKKGKRVLAQCKHWKSTSVGAPVVREMYGLMVAEKMDAVLIVTSGKFTKEALKFAEGKPIILINGLALVKLIGDLKRA